MLIYAGNEKGNTIAQSINVATFNAKTGKRVEGLVMVGAFGGTTAGFANINISADLKNFTCATFTLAGKNEVVFEISEKGTIKDSK